MTLHVSLSGGMDSTALLSVLLRTRHLDADFEPILTYGFDYGQRHVTELTRAEAIADRVGVPFARIVLPQLSSPALTEGTAVPHGHYAWDTMTLTVVQGRNMLMASTLVSLTRPGDTVAVGVHTGDHAIYPDCRPEFWEPYAQAVKAAYDVNIITPFIDLSKADIAKVGQQAGAPFDLSWSCYEGGMTHCGRCGTCVERAEAFHLAGVPDPTLYTDPHYWRTVTEEVL